MSNNFFESKQNINFLLKIYNKIKNNYENKIKLNNYKIIEVKKYNKNIDFDLNENLKYLSKLLNSKNNINIYTLKINYDLLDQTTGQMNFIKFFKFLVMNNKITIYLDSSLKDFIISPLFNYKKVKSEKYEDFALTKNNINFSELVNSLDKYLKNKSSDFASQLIKNNKLKQFENLLKLSAYYKTPYFKLNFFHFNNVKENYNDINNQIFFIEKYNAQNNISSEVLIAANYNNYIIYNIKNLSEYPEYNVSKLNYKKYFITDNKFTLYKFDYNFYRNIINKYTTEKISTYC